MRAVAVLASPRGGTSVCIDGLQVNVGLVELEDPVFDAQDPVFAESVLVRKAAFSLNFRDKRKILQMAVAGSGDQFAVIGSDFAGEVVDAGANVTSFRPGDRVLNNNAYPRTGDSQLPAGIASTQASREYEVLHMSRLAPVPETMPDDIAAGFSLGAQTAYAMLRRLELQQPANVLVFSAKSNTALFALQALQKYRLRVYAVSNSGGFAGELRRMGVEEPIELDGGKRRLTEDPEILRVCREGGFHYVVDPFCDLHLRDAIQVMAVGGRYVTCGFFDQYLEYTGHGRASPPRLERPVLAMLLIKNLTVMGNCIGTAEDLGRALCDYSAGSFAVTVDMSFEGDQVAEFIGRTFASPERFGKVIYRFSQSPDRRVVH